MTFYNVSDVQKKVDNYLGENSFKVNPLFSRVENLRDTIEGVVRKGCLNNKLKYQMQFNQVIETMEGAILSSPNWFNESGLNFKSYRHCLKVEVERMDEYLKNLELRKYVHGNKNEKHYDIKDIVCIAQAKRFKSCNNFFDTSNWLFNKSIRFQNITIEDNSDAYHEDIINYKACARNGLAKKFSNNYIESTILLLLHYHSYSEEGNPKDKNYDYCPTIEKFELVLLI